MKNFHTFLLTYIHLKLEVDVKVGEGNFDSVSIQSYNQKLYGCQHKLYWLATEKTNLFSLAFSPYCVIKNICRAA